MQKRKKNTIETQVACITLFCIVKIVCLLLFEWCSKEATHMFKLVYIFIRDGQKSHIKDNRKQLYICIYACVHIDVYCVCACLCVCLTIPKELQWVLRNTVVLFVPRMLALHPHYSNFQKVMFHMIGKVNRTVLTLIH